MLGAASDYFESVYQDRPIDDAALEEIIDGLASTRFSPADSHKLERAYPLEEMSKAQESCKSTHRLDLTAFPLNSTGLSAEPSPRNIAHIHLIHKRGERDQLVNKRPISLINADERIISQAHNQRLAPLLESLIGPTQRGFVPNRWIGTNIAEVQCLMDPGLPGSVPVSGLLAVMDFEKAYDRLSHTYLDAVLPTYTNQSASIFLNGWLSAAFDVLSGVRQGDPLAPSLFVLAIEGFACQIRSRVKGIESPGLQTIRELLFADDACCALHDLSDLKHLDRAIRLDHPVAPRLGTWRLSASHFRYLGIQVGVDIAEDAGWEEVKSSTIARINSIPMYDLPYADKCSIVNIYCYTKILYYNRFLPAPKSVVKEIEDAAMLAIHGRASDGTQRRPRVSRSRLYTPLDHGGFGLIDLPRRLNPSGEPAYPLYLAQTAPNQHRRPWIWIWWAYFCHPPPKWDHAAWASVTTLNPPELSKNQNLERWANHVLFFPAGHGIQVSVNPTLFRGPDGEKIFSLPEQRWNSWWKALRKVRRVHSDAEDTAHLLSLGSLHPGAQLASPVHTQLNNRSTFCVMCLSEATESLAHLAVGCPFARRLWGALSPAPHPTFLDFVCPVVSRSERRLVELRILFFHSIWKLSCRRRFSSDPLEPITETGFEDLRASFRSPRSPCVSLIPPKGVLVGMVDPDAGSMRPTLLA
ncbi:BQ2448_28 [Microbotryum intermedium]|uniref:BQ2448_28 protein n=1 Tax=Microbotryum intermedium TaxID=269621 RepID=A0A238FGE1_9BASI|nr:BQ2448_28 [Microbotryum intermedium]